MKRCHSGFVSGLVLCVAAASHAERGAVSIDASWGAALIDVRAPYAQGAPSQEGSSFTTSLGFRYALTNTFEVGAAGFYQPPTTFTHGNAQVSSPGGLLPGTLSERTQQYGFLARGRFVRGLVWRFFAGADIGFASRSFSNINHYDVSDPSAGARNYGLVLSDTSQKALVLAPSAGVEWTGDHFTIGLAPRVEFLVGTVKTWAVSLPLSIAWSWYL